MPNLTPAELALEAWTHPEREIRRTALAQAEQACREIEEKERASAGKPGDPGYDNWGIRVAERCADAIARLREEQR